MRYSREQLEALWIAAKRRRGYWRLKSRSEVEFEFKGQFGHPSSYAYVKLECAPADHLSFESTAEWPKDLSAHECKDFEKAVAEAVVDVLLAGTYPHSGCSVKLSAVRFDAIGSSFVAYARAATGALNALVQGGWDIVPPTVA